MIGSVDIYFHGSPYVVFFLSVASSFKKMADNSHAYFWGGKWFRAQTINTKHLTVFLLSLTILCILNCSWLIFSTNIKL